MTRIAATVDLDKTGVQHGFLKLPHSTHESAYGWIPIPITVAANGNGPSVLLVAGNHGDEYEGQIALMKLVRSLDASRLQGRLIVLTAANYPAVTGSGNGTPTEMIAHYIESVLLARCQ